METFWSERVACDSGATKVTTIFGKDYNPDEPEYNPDEPEYNPNEPEYNPNEPEDNPNEPEYNPNEPCSIALTLLGFLLADYIKGSAPYWLNVNLAEAFSFKAGINCSNNNKQNSNQLYTQQNFTHREIKAKLPSPRHF